MSTVQYTRPKVGVDVFSQHRLFELFLNLKVISLLQAGIAKSISIVFSERLPVLFCFNQLST